jgi:hypothetical protein
MVWLSGYETVDNNYWSDYLTRYPNAKEIGNSGIWDTPYEYLIVDSHPLMNPVSIAIPEFPSLIFVLPIIVAVGVGLLVYSKRRKS